MEEINVQKNPCSKLLKLAINLFLPRQYRVPYRSLTPGQALFINIDSLFSKIHVPSTGFPMSASYINFYSACVLIADIQSRTSNLQCA